MSDDAFFEMNRQGWNARTEYHLASDFYDVEGFLRGECALTPIEKKILGDVSGKSLLHLQCHFGQDTLSWARRGAQVCGVDLSDKSIEAAKNLAQQLQIDAEFVCCNVYDTRKHVQKQFDIVFTSYGVIGWLPDLAPWARVIAESLKPGGTFLLVEFHPVVWMFNDEFSEVAWPYFNVAPIIEENHGTYADPNAPIHFQSAGWNHSIAEVVNALLEQGLRIELLDEYDYSPYPIFRNGVQSENGWQVKDLEGKLPLVYAVRAVKS